MNGDCTVEWLANFEELDEGCNEVVNYVGCTTETSPSMFTKCFGPLTACAFLSRVTSALVIGLGMALIWEFHPVCYPVYAA